MEVISINEFNALCSDPNYRVLKYVSDKRPKIVETMDEAIIKVFYGKKKWYSKDHYYPKAKRFYDHGNRLNELNVAAPEVEKLQYCPELKVHLVKYKKCIGKECRQLIRDNNPVALADVFKFIALLHEKGIFFRAIHLANILYDPDKGFSLIDIADVRFKNKPLGWLARYRNLKHLFRSVKDQAYWQQIGIEKIFQLYLAQTHFSPRTKKIVQRLGVMRMKSKVPYFRANSKILEPRP